MAALTVAVTLVSQQAPAIRLGNVRAVAAKVRVNSTGLDAGGAALVARDFGLQELYILLIAEDAGDNGSVVGGGHVAQYNYVTGKLQFFEEEGTAAGGPLLEVNHDISDVTVRVLAIGV